MIKTYDYTEQSPVGQGKKRLYMDYVTYCVYLEKLVEKKGGH